MDFCKNPTFACIFLDFFEKSIFFLEFFWIFDIRIGKTHLFPRFFLDVCKNPSFSWFFLDFWYQDWKNPSFSSVFLDSCKNPSFSLGFFTFFEKSIFFLEFFWIFDLETQKSKHPFEESKKTKKNLGKSKIPSFWPESKDSVWKDGFLDFWIFWQPARPRCLQHSDIRCIFAWNTLLKFSHIVASPGVLQLVTAKQKSAHLKPITS